MGVVGDVQDPLVDPVDKLGLGGEVHRQLGPDGPSRLVVVKDANRTGVEELLAKKRVDFIFPADYREGRALEEMT